MSISAQRTTVHVALAERSYDIVIGRAELETIAHTIEPWVARDTAQAPRTAAVMTDRHVVDHARTVLDSLTESGWRVDSIVLEPGEPTKCLEVASECYDWLVNLKADRRTVVLAVGGGVIGDLAGFVAATYARGIPFIQVPTTLLADVDSSVGGKVGVNHPRAKNLIGAFYQPLGVVIDTDVLRTLPDRDYRSGLAEVVKYGVILDAEFFRFLESHTGELSAREPRAVREAIARSCRLKADVVEQDEHERTGLRAVLNYGHTFAHAFEALCGYGELLHGEAVAVGMVYASRLAERTGRIAAADTARQVRLMEALLLPTRLPDPARLTVADLLDRMRLDKKSVGGRLRFVLPTRIGHVDLMEDLPEAEVAAVLQEMGHG